MTEGCDKFKYLDDTKDATYLKKKLKNLPYNYSTHMYIQFCNIGYNTEKNGENYNSSNGLLKKVHNILLTTIRFRNE